MMRARSILDSLLSEAGAYITTQDVYDFYYLWWLLLHQPEVFKTQYGEYILSDHTQRLRAKYISVFKKLLCEQLQKYLTRGRVDPDFDLKGITLAEPAEVLWHKMEKTWRSDMKRRNVVWNLIGEYLAGLEAATAPDKICLYLDRLNNCVHNTGTPILDKLKDGYALMQALDTVAGHAPNMWKNRVGKDLRQLEAQE